MITENLIFLSTGSNPVLTIMNLTKTNPIRLRSKKCLLTYENTVISLDILLNHLKNIFCIKSDSYWKYILKREYYENQDPKTIVYLEFNHSPDIYTGNLTFKENNKDIVCKCWPVSNKELALTYILKSCKPLKNDSNFKTNMDSNLVTDYSNVLKYNELFEPSKHLSNSNFIFKRSNNQHRKMLKYYENFDPKVCDNNLFSS